MKRNNYYYSNNKNNQNQKQNKKNKSNKQRSNNQKKNNLIQIMKQIMIQMMNYLKESYKQSNLKKGKTSKNKI